MCGVGGEVSLFALDKVQISLLRLPANSQLPGRIIFTSSVPSFACIGQQVSDARL
jgi:hypothetical protein